MSTMTQLRNALFTLCLLACVVLPVVLLSNPTSSAGGQLTDIQGIRDTVLLHAASFDWIKWSLLAGLATIGLCFTALFFAIRDTRQDIQKLESNTRQDMQRLESNTRQDIQKLESRIDKLDSRIDKLDSKLESGIQENRKLLMQLIQNTEPARQKQTRPVKRASLR